jgi:hypothetical protein
MKKIFILSLFVSLIISLNAQINLGANFSFGFNTVFSSSKRQENYGINTKYAFSYEVGLSFEHNLFKKTVLEIETNFFRKNYQVDDLMYSMNYFEVPIYLLYKFKNLGLILGTANNFFMGEKIINKFFTISIKTGFSYRINTFLTFKCVYNQELLSHTLPVRINGNTTNNTLFFRNFMFGFLINFNSKNKK